MTKNLYVVQNGRAGRCQRDGRNLLVGGIEGASAWWREPGCLEPDLSFCFALADDRAEALALARAYDRGDLWTELLMWQGIAVYALSMPPIADDVAGPVPAVLVATASALSGLILAAMVAAIVLIAMH